MYLATLHLPYAQREDCLQVWERTGEELDEHLSALRYHDVVCIGADLNMEVFAASQDERHVHLQDLLLNHALSIPHQQEPTWINSRGSASALDYFLYRDPQARLVTDKVMPGPELLVGSDH